MNLIKKSNILLILLLSFTLTNCAEKKKRAWLPFAALLVASSQQNTTPPATPAQPEIPSFTIGGTIEGLTESGLVISLNGGNDLTISSGSTSFVFSTPVKQGSTYTVAVVSSKPSNPCTVQAKGTGTVSANVTDVKIGCSG